MSDKDTKDPQFRARVNANAEQIGFANLAQEGWAYMLVLACGAMILIGTFTDRPGAAIGALFILGGTAVGRVSFLARQVLQLRK